MDSRLEDAAKIFGAHPITTIRTVTLPLLKPIIASSTVLVLVLGFEMFSIPAILGGPRGITTLAFDMYSYVQTAPASWESAAVIGSVLIVICVTGVIWQRRLIGNVDRYQSSEGPPLATLNLGAYRSLGGSLAIGYVFVTTVLPVLGLAVTSFMKYSPGLALKGDIFTFDIWRGVLGSDLFHLAVKNSLLVMCIGGLGGTFIAFIVTVSIYGARPKFNDLIEYVARLPIAIPGVVLGAGILWAYFKIPWPIYGTIWIILIGVVAKYLPVVFNLIAGRYTQIEESLRDAALVAGASRYRVIRDIDVRLMRGAVLGALMLNIVLIAGEVNVSIMVFTPDSSTLPVYLWQVIAAGTNYQYVYVVALIQAMMTSVLLLIMWRLSALKSISKVGLRI
jgi:iron(III) transport system permease protein